MKKLLLALLFTLLSFNVNASTKAFHFILRGVPLTQAYWIIDKLVENQYNTVIPLITDGVDLDNQVWVSKVDSWSKSEFISFINYAKSKGLIVIPELKLLTHQEKFYAANQTPEPILMYNKLTYNRTAASDPLVYGQVYALIDEIIDIIHPPAFHIGHDELGGWNNALVLTDLNPGEKPLPVDKYYGDVMNLHNHLAAKGIRTWMWADMLETPSEFPTQRAVDFHGGVVTGYGKTLRARIPKDIVLCDWHYKDPLTLVTYHSLNKLVSEGFITLGAVWENPNAFTHSAKLGGAAGMIATSFTYVQLRDWVNVEKLIVNSAAAFNKDF